MGFGCSTTMLHLPVAHEAVRKNNVCDGKRIFKNPEPCHLPGGSTFKVISTMPAAFTPLWRSLNKKGLLDTPVMTVTGKTLGENLVGVKNPRPRGYFSVPLKIRTRLYGAIAVLKGKSAPEAVL